MNNRVQVSWTAWENRRLCCLSLAWTLFNCAYSFIIISKYKIRDYLQKSVYLSNFLDLKKRENLSLELVCPSGILFPILLKFSTYLIFVKKSNHYSLMTNIMKMVIWMLRDFKIEYFKKLTWYPWVLLSVLYFYSFPFSYNCMQFNNVFPYKFFFPV